MNKRIALIASFFGLTAVLLGAFGAHGLKKIIDITQVAIWQKGVEYQFYHTFALLYLSLNTDIETKYKKYCFYLFIIGIILFSGSLYILSLNNYLKISYLNYIGPITPIGGLLLMLGWLCLFLGIKKFNK